jgi:hypothetical protein
MSRYGNDPVRNQTKSTNVIKMIFFGSKFANYLNFQFFKGVLLVAL